MNRLKAYIIWLWKIKPKIHIKIRSPLGRKILLKLALKRYCDQSPKITPWPYKDNK